MKNKIIDNLTDAEKEQATAIFIKALNEWTQNGAAITPCDACGSAITFERNGSACFHKCRCGKYTGTLRGLL